MILVPNDSCIKSHIEKYEAYKIFIKGGISHFTNEFCKTEIGLEY
jgi:hypothetical protein